MPSSSLSPSSSPSSSRLSRSSSFGSSSTAITTFSIRSANRFGSDASASSTTRSNSARESPSLPTGPLVRLNEDLGELAAAQRVGRDDVRRALVVLARVDVQEALGEAQVDGIGAASPVPAPVRGRDPFEQYGSARALVEQVGRGRSADRKVARDHDHRLARPARQTPFFHRRDVQVETRPHVRIEIGERTLAHDDRDRHVLRARLRRVGEVHEIEREQERQNHDSAPPVQGDEVGRGEGGRSAGGRAGKRTFISDRASVYPAGIRNAETGGALRARSSTAYARCALNGAAPGSSERSIVIGNAVKSSASCVVAVMCELAESPFFRTCRSKMSPVVAIPAVVVWPESFSDTSRTSSVLNGETPRAGGRAGAAVGIALACGEGLGRGKNGCTRYCFVASFHSVIVFARRSTIAVTVIGGIGKVSLFSESTSIRISPVRCEMPSCAEPSYKPPCAVTVTFACACAEKPAGGGAGDGEGFGV